MVQATLQLSLVAIQNISRRYWMIQFNQSWSENMGINRQNTVFHELWQEFSMRPVTFESPLNLSAQKRVMQNSEKELPLKSY